MPASSTITPRSAQMAAGLSPRPWSRWWPTPLHQLWGIQMGSMRCTSCTTAPAKGSPPPKATRERERLQRSHRRLHLAPVEGGRAEHPQATPWRTCEQLSPRRPSRVAKAEVQAEPVPGADPVPQAVALRPAAAQDLPQIHWWWSSWRLSPQGWTHSKAEEAEETVAARFQLESFGEVSTYGLHRARNRLGGAGVGAAVDLPAVLLEVAMP